VSTSRTTLDPAALYFAEAKKAGAECLAAALDYLGRGWSALAICPPDHAGVGKTHGQNCTSPGKSSWGPWKKYQTELPTENDIRRKWRDNPLLNVGIALGPVSRLVRIDVDGEEGPAFLKEMSGGPVPLTLEMISGGGGRGLLFAIPAGVVLRPTHHLGEKIHSGVSLLGQGSLTVLPPSRHKDRGRYVWVPGQRPDEVEPAPAPPWLISRMSKEQRGTGHFGAVPKLADGEILREGKRDTILTSLAGSMRRRGMTPEEIFVGLSAVNQRCDPPLEEEQVRKIANSMGRYEPVNGEEIALEPSSAEALAALEQLAVSLLETIQSRPDLLVAWQQALGKE
jgi:putative DNA primase/helicase